MLRCRAMKDKNVVYFGSYGKNEDGTAMKADNFSSNNQAVADSLTQRLSVIKSELWYAVDYGVPLLDKLRSKLQVDFVVADMIERHPDVVNIEEFISEVVDHKYTCHVKVNTTYGLVDIQI